MEQPFKIIILYAGYGDGHYQVSSALKESFELQGGFQVKLINLFAESHPIMDAFTRYLYMKSCSYTPEMYGWSYYMTKNMPQDTFLAHWFHSFGIHRLKEILICEKPDAIIQTFPFLAMSELKRHLDSLDIPAYTLITDFMLHHRWIHSGTNKYFVATKDLKKQLVMRGIPPEKIIISGLPLRPSFYKRIDSSSLYQKYGLRHERETILVMAGAYGILQGLERMVHSLLEKEEVQILVVCGKNKKLLDRMKDQFSQKSSVRIYGFVQSIEELMAVSSCVVTKAGGVTLSESLVMGLPIFVYRPLPGQEKENAIYLQKNGAALVAHTHEELLEQISHFLNDPQLVRQIKSNIQAICQKDSINIIMDEILSDIEEKKYTIFDYLHRVAE